MTTRRGEGTYTIKNTLFTQMRLLVEASGAEAYVEGLNGGPKGPGGRPSAEIKYTFRAVLVAMAFLTYVGILPSMAEVFRVMIWVFTDEQRASLGVILSEEDRRRLCRDELAQRREYTRFQQWLTRLLTCLDSHADIPARRLTNADAKLRLSKRNKETSARSLQAWLSAHTVVNLIVAGSVADKAPAGYEGDIVVDETTYDVSAVRRGDGTKPHAYRSPVAMAALYRRGKGTVQDGADGFSGTTEKMAEGIGVTAIVRHGAVKNIRNVTPLITAISFGRTTSGSVQATEMALKHHLANGLDPRKPTDGKNRRQPTCTTDMGYNVKNGWAEMLYRYGYSPVGRYPAPWHTVSELLPLAGDRDPDQVAPGPIMASGAIYCPFAAGLIGDDKGWVRRSADLLKDGGEERDRALAARLPLLMGTNSRLRMAALNPGRPSKTAPRVEVPKVDLICPAVQGRVRCPLKPESMIAPSDQVRTIQPTWAAESKKCCSQGHVTVALNPQQFKQYQPAYVPGSWEHTYFYEAVRALNERAFGIVKSPHESNVQKMNWGARREPIIMLSIALMVAITNYKRQWGVIEPSEEGEELTELAKPEEPEELTIGSYLENLAKLARRLGRPPTMIPPRT
ncbi:hypothetical protein SAMN04488544_3354 [Microlunatus sagamiharensis]|uniref:Uncharacterized protein n=1 Tax=Microlunatus sagamiharensis TaxID=546874 RepID=A0A1H2N5N4_9ACTN|nr:hypothetical protein [Microlunatus sagamiharensis]SDV00672.1 hypothetical protein SAMN04488544_3354 [Microlunatus sagamiharensis]